MSRYYDIDKLKQMIEAKADTLIEGKEAFLYVAKWIDFLPTADVVPRAEVERLSGRNHKCIYLSDDETTEYCVDGPCPKFKTEAQIKTEATKEAAKQVFAEIDKIIDEVYNRHIFGNNDLDDIEHEAIMNFSADISYRIDELKQKYSQEVRQ